MTETKQAPDLARDKPERRLPALAVSRGIGIGRVVFLHGEKRHFFRLDLDAVQLEAELERFKTALGESIRQLRELAANDKPDPNQPVSGIFGVHLLILESSLVEKIETIIKDQRVNAEWAIRTVSDQYLERQEAVSDLNFRDKYLDIEDVANRLLTTLSGSPATTQTDADAVIVARDLRPSVIMELARSKPAALITEHGGWTSHASILAREFNLPMVSGVRNLEHFVLNDDSVIVDGINGEVILNPGAETLATFGALITSVTNSNEADRGTAGGAATLDGTKIAIRANVDLPEAYAAAQNIGAEGIGLFRSESLIRRPGAIPTENEQVGAYCRIADAADDSGVRIRTFDIGIEQLEGDGLSTERNPSLGLRSIRLSLLNSGHFRIQIRAILRASVDRRIDIVLPMISGVGDVLKCRSIINEETENLTKEGISIGEPRVGVMIEVPSAVLTVREIVGKVDFLCLGTNDLVQYLLAVDRDNDAVADFYQSLHPAVIRAISEVLAAADSAGIPVSVCGEIAGSAFYVPLLVGLGARELSMNVNSIQQIRNLLSGISVAEALDLTQKIKICETADETENVLREYYLENWSSLFPPGLLSARHR